ncbi:EAL domain-containing protein [Simplicispira suum]|uniref:GGDEF domain-containing protein n=1 Tax=Simplicispira suum TaxID=2109915 RepID=A0A2S0N436_9BURK|nr:EAL domain-containing protein [Simplicispira suum]AVO42777.1 GGDEF domain-containing protein [Simplicispira suum]
MALPLTRTDPLPDAMPGDVMAVDEGRVHNITTLLSSEAKFSAMSQALPDPCGITRVVDGRYIEVNPAFCALVGIPREQIVGRTSLELEIWDSPQERERLLEVLARDGRVDQLSMKARAQGRVVPGLMSVSPVEIDGEDCIVFVFHDMTREKSVQDGLLAAHALMTQAGQMARLGAWESDEHGTVIRWSDVCCEVHGLPPGTAPPLDYIGQSLTPASQEALRNAARACLRDGTEWTLDLQVIRADNGQLRWMRAHGEAVREGGRTLRMQGVMQDIDAAHQAEEALRESQQRFRLIFQMLPYPMGITRCADGTYVDVNPAWESMTGVARSEAIGSTVLALGLYSADDRATVLEPALRGEEDTPVEATLRSRVGPALTVQQSTRKITLGSTECWLFALHDITDRKRAEKAMREREAVLSLTLEAASVGLWDCDITNGLVTGDARWNRMRGVDQSTEQTVPFDQCAGSGDAPRMRAELRRHARAPATKFDLITTVPGALEGQRWMRNLGKIVAWGDDGKPSRMLGVTIDVTGQREQELLLQRLAHYDALTDLPNRVLMARQLSDAMEQARTSGQLLGVAYLDLDGFKPVNDRFGHDAGDELLRCVARRLSAALRPQDCVARLGGDEFAILLPDLSSSEDAQRALARLMEGISAPYSLQGETIGVTASIGYTLFPRDDADADTLLRHADQAMYAAKQAGRNRFHEFDAAQEREMLQMRAQIVHLREALAAGQFELYLQPKVDMRLGTVVGAEALARWNHPQRGVLSPGAFLPFIEGTELETLFGAWVVDAGLTLLDDFCKAGLQFPLSINIAAPHLQQKDFAPWMSEQLKAHPQAPVHLLDIEITEATALFHLDRVAQTLRELRALGITISLDDFGTGYSSLTYLRRLPLNTLKIDQSFVSGMMDQAGDLAIVQGVIGLARSFGYKVIAEGVETEDQGQMLLQMGCAQAQGYFIARPMPAAAFLTWLHSWQAPEAWVRLN